MASVTSPVGTNRVRTNSREKEPQPVAAAGRPLTQRGLRRGLTGDDGTGRSHASSLLGIARRSPIANTRVEVGIGDISEKFASITAIVKMSTAP